MTIITATHIERDVVNNELTVVFSDENFIEWVYEHSPICAEGGGRMVLVEKSKAFAFDIKNKK